MIRRSGLFAYSLGAGVWLLATGWVALELRDFARERSRSRMPLTKPPRPGSFLSIPDPDAHGEMVRLRESFDLRTKARAEYEQAGRDEHNAVTALAAARRLREEITQLNSQVHQLELQAAGASANVSQRLRLQASDLREQIRLKHMELAQKTREAQSSKERAAEHHRKHDTLYREAEELYPEPGRSPCNLRNASSER